MSPSVWIGDPSPNHLELVMLPPGFLLLVLLMSLSSRSLHPPVSLEISPRLTSWKWHVFVSLLYGFSLFPLIPQSTMMALLPLLLFYSWKFSQWALINHWLPALDDVVPCGFYMPAVPESTCTWLLSPFLFSWTCLRSISFLLATLPLVSFICCCSLCITCFLLMWSYCVSRFPSKFFKS